MKISKKLLFVLLLVFLVPLIIWALRTQTLETRKKAGSTSDFTKVEDYDPILHNVIEIPLTVNDILEDHDIKIYTSPRGPAKIEKIIITAHDLTGDFDMEVKNADTNELLASFDVKSVPDCEEMSNPLEDCCKEQPIIDTGCDKTTDKISITVFSRDPVNDEYVYIKQIAFSYCVDATPTPIPPPEATATPIPPPPVCTMPLDLFEILDASKSITNLEYGGHPDNPEKIKTFAKNIAHYLDLGASDSELKMGVIRLSDFPLLITPLINDKEKFLWSINWYYRIIAGTNITSSLQKAWEELNGPQARPDFAKAIILISDGAHDIERFPSTPEQVVNQIKQQGGKIFVVGVGDQIDRQQLENIASEPTKNYFFYADDFDKLQDALDQLITNICASTGQLPSCTNVRYPSQIRQKENFNISFETGQKGGQKVYNFTDTRPYPPATRPWLILGGWGNTSNEISLPINFEPDTYKFGIDVFNQDCSLICSPHPDGGQLFTVQGCQYNNLHGSIGNCINECYGEFEIRPPTTTTGFNFKLKILPEVNQNQEKDIQVILIKQGGGEEVKTTKIKAGSQSIFEGRIGNILPNVYDVYLKPESFLQRKIESIEIDEGENSFDWTKINFIAGDFDNNNVLDIFDLSMLLQQYTNLQVPVNPQNKKFDINLDNTINIFDIALVLQGYTDLQIEGDGN